MENIMKEFLYIGACPYNVVPVKLGSENYHVKARRQCELFLEQVRRVYGDEVGEARLVVESFRRGSTDYLELICYYEINEPLGRQYASDVEADVKHGLEEWD